MDLHEKVIEMIRIVCCTPLDTLVEENVLAALSTTRSTRCGKRGSRTLLFASSSILARQLQHNQHQEAHRLKRTLLTLLNICPRRGETTFAYARTSCRDINAC